MKKIICILLAFLLIVLVSAENGRRRDKPRVYSCKQAYLG
jgi:hypothetical protein